MIETKLLLRRMAYALPELTLRTPLTIRGKARTGTKRSTCSTVAR